MPSTEVTVGLNFTYHRNYILCELKSPYKNYQSLCAWHIVEILCKLKSPFMNYVVWVRLSVHTCCEFYVTLCYPFRTRNQQAPGLQSNPGWVPPLWWKAYLYSPGPILWYRVLYTLSNDPFIDPSWRSGAIHWWSGQLECGIVVRLRMCYMGHCNTSHSANAQPQK